MDDRFTSTWYYLVLLESLLSSLYSKTLFSMKLRFYELFESKKLGKNVCLVKKDRVKKNFILQKKIGFNIIEEKFSQLLKMWPSKPIR